MSSRATGALKGDLRGVAAIGGACLAWAIDNNLTQRLTLRGPVAVVRWKGLGAGTLSLPSALTVGERLPEPRFLAAALLLGVFSYGVSILLDMFAFRLPGAAREAARGRPSPPAPSLSSRRAPGGDDQRPAWPGDPHAAGCLQERTGEKGGGCAGRGQCAPLSSKVDRLRA